MRASKRKNPWLSPFSNWYFILLVAFVIWMAFFDGNDIGTQLRLNNKIVELENEKIELSEKIDQTASELKALRDDKEKFAREKYYMKKDNEDVFIIDKK